MEANILDLVKGQLSDTILSKVAGFLGEDHAAASKAMGLILPSVLGGMANKASNADGATELFGLMNNFWFARHVARRRLGNSRVDGHGRKRGQRAFWQQNEQYCERYCLGCRYENGFCIELDEHCCTDFDERLGAQNGRWCNGKRLGQFVGVAIAIFEKFGLACVFNERFRLVEY
jgi:hypothetical protein